jgi:hypothetical protein
MSLKEGLINAVKQGKYILIGEDHSPCVESIRWEIKDTLKLLKKIGVTRMAFEIDYIHQPLLQTLDFNSLFILSDLKREISNRIPEGNYRMLVEAKKIGMQVLFIDDHSLFNSEADHYQRQQRRDDTMFKIIENTKDAGKTLIYIGSSHVYQNCTEKFEQGQIHRIGEQLYNRHGNSVVSIRYVSSINAPFMPDEKGVFSPYIMPAVGPLPIDDLIKKTDYFLVGP